MYAAAAAYIVVTLPGRGQAEEPGIGSVWLLLQQAGVGGSRTSRGIVQAAVLALAAGAVWWLVRRTGRPTALTCARAGLVVVAAALVVAPAAPPELALVLLPLAAIGVRRWRDLLVWQGLHLVSWVITGWYLGDALVPTVADDARAYWLAIVLRVAGLLWLVAAVLRSASADEDSVEVGRGEADTDVDLLADAGDARA